MNCAWVHDQVIYVFIIDQVMLKMWEIREQYIANSENIHITSHMQNAYEKDKKKVCVPLYVWDKKFVCPRNDCIGRTSVCLYMSEIKG